MMNLSEEVLETQGVTKGARHKIILSIKKLKDRVHRLQQIHEEMSTDRDAMKGALNEVKWMLATPIKPCETGKQDGSDNKVQGGAAPGQNQEDYENTQGGNRDSQQDQGDKENDCDVTVWIVRVIGKGTQY